MGAWLLILSLLFSLVIALVAAANHQPVAVSYLFGKTEVSLIVLIIGSAAAGALAMGLFSLYRGIRTAFRARAERRRCEELQARLAGLEQEKGSLQRELEKLRGATTAAGEGEAP